MADKVRGMFLGVGIGDSLGMAVEGWQADRISEQYPDGVRDYKLPVGHKWFEGQLAGSGTDDTYLTLATAEAMIEGEVLNLESQSQHLVAAMREATRRAPKEHKGGSGVPGWGITTASAVRNMANNVPWWESGKTSNPHRGHGNGVVMRQSPIAPVWLTYRKHFALYGREHVFYQWLVDFSAMTHYTKQSAIAAIVHNAVLTRCLEKCGADYHIGNDFYAVFDSCRSIFGTLETSHLVDTEIDMWLELDKVTRSKDWDPDKIRAEFGAGSCNVGHSLPFSYAFWAKNCKDITSLYTVVEAGGDTDTNGSVIGGMLGALHGQSVFPQHLKDGLLESSRLLNAAEALCFKLKKLSPGGR